MIEDIIRSEVKKHAGAAAHLLNSAQPLLMPINALAQSKNPFQKTAKKIQKSADALTERIIKEVL